MKQTKKLFALLLVICMVLAMIPAVSAEEAEPKTVVYDFDFVKIATAADGKQVGTGLTAEDVQNQIAGLNDKGYINWDYVATSSGVVIEGSADYVFGTSGWFRNRTGLNSWVAFSIDNPGDGMWNLTANIPQTTRGSTAVDMYILPADTVKSASTQVDDIADAIREASPITVFSCNADSQTGKPAEPVAADIKQNVILTDPTNAAVQATWEPGSVEENPTYILVLKTAATNKNGQYAYAFFSQLMMTPVLATVTDGETATDYTDADALADAISSADSDTEIKLLSDITVSDFTLNSDVKLDLNGKTLNATVNDAAGQIIDSSGGAGRVKGATLGDLAANQMVLTDKDGYLHICNYTLSLPAAFDAVEAAENGDSVRFWFNVRFENAAAYDVIAGGSSGFSVGANFQWNDNTSVGAKFGTDLSVEDWASKMKSDPNYYFYVDVDGLENAAASGTLTVLPTVSDEQGTSSITSGLTYTVNVAQ